MGCAGRVRYVDLIRYAAVEPVPDHIWGSEEFNAHHYLVRTVIPAWREAVTEGVKDEPEYDKAWPHGAAIIVLADQIFEVGGDFSVTLHEEFGGVGSGADFALGALAAGKSVERAMEIAGELDLFTGTEHQVIKGL